MIEGFEDTEDFLTYTKAMVTLLLREASDPSKAGLVVAFGVNPMVNFVKSVIDDHLNSTAK